MSADTITDAVVSWIQAPNVVGLNRVYGEPPWFEGGPEFQLDGQLGWGAVAFVHVDSEQEHRIALGGPQGGLKQVDYEIGILVAFQYLIGVRTDVDPDSAVAWRRPLNTVLDGLRGRIRQDRTLGTSPGTSGLGGVQVQPGGSILMAGEGDGQPGNPDLVMHRDLPKRSPDGRRLWSWSLLQLRVVEIAAT